MALSSKPIRSHWRWKSLKTSNKYTGYFCQTGGNCAFGGTIFSSGHWLRLVDRSTILPIDIHQVYIMIMLTPFVHSGYFGFFLESFQVINEILIRLWQPWQKVKIGSKCKCLILTFYFKLMFKFKRCVLPPPFSSFSHRLDMLLPALLSAICLLVLPSSSTPEDESGTHCSLSVPVTFTAAIHHWQPQLH